jgi:hypothetical protein
MLIFTENTYWGTWLNCTSIEENPVDPFPSSSLRINSIGLLDQLITVMAIRGTTLAQHRD